MKTKILLKKINIVLICLSMLSFNSCKDKKDITPEEPSLSIGMPDGTAAPSKLEMSAEGSSQKFAIASNGTWKITKQEIDTDWLTVTPQEGSKNGEITINIAKNTEINSREAVLMFAVNGQENIKTYSVSQLGFGPNLSVTPEAPEVLPEDGDDITFTITSNDDQWEYAITGEPDWLTEKEKTVNALTLTAVKNSDAPRATTITFKLSNHPSVTQVVELSQGGSVLLTANMLDVQFNLDGTAIDISPMQHTVTKISFDYPFTVSYNETYKRNMVTFNPEENGVNPGANKASFYRIDYDAGFENKLANGHSFECLVKFDVDYTQTPRSYETKFFSTQESGGTGFLIANANQATGGNGLTFLPNIPATQGGGTSWKWTNSQVKPDGQSWYHVIGVWDKDAGKASIYVNGEKRAEVPAIGYYRPVDSEAMRWVAIGGDAGRIDALQSPFAGSLAIARIYDKALTETEAEYLWNQIKPN